MKLSIKIVSLILLVLLLLLFFFGWNLIEAEKRVLTGLLTDWGNSEAATIALFAVAPLLKREYAILHDFIATLKNENLSIRSLRITHHGEPVIRFTRNGSGSSSTAIMSFKADILHTAKKNSMPEKLGEVVIAFTSANQEMIISRRIQHIVISIIAIFLVLLLTLIYILRKAVIEKVTRITAFAESPIEAQYQKLERERDSVENSRDEIDLLYYRFILLLERIKARDIEKNAALRELKKAESFLNNVINSMPSVLVGVDMDGMITNWNSEAEKISGFSAEAAMGEPLSEKMPILAGQLESINRAIRVRQILEKTKIPVKSNGSLHYFDLTVYPLSANGINGAVIRIDDATNRVRLEEMMIQTEKMMSVGGLAAGMAHEINNPLGIILQGVQNTFRRISPDLPRNREVAEACSLDLGKLNRYLEKRNILGYLSGISEAGERASKIVKNMLNFSRRSDSKMEPVHINTLLDETLELAYNDYDLKKKYDFRHIHIEKRYADYLPEISCTKTEIEQVLLNLFKNAAEALHGWKNQDRKVISLETSLEPEDICIGIADNGPGMSDAIRKRVFEPFFTTKDVGVGTGLGLSVSYFIVTTNHGGQMTVSSEPGQGTRFQVRLPVKRSDDG